MLSRFFQRSALHRFHLRGFANPIKDFTEPLKQAKFVTCGRPEKVEDYRKMLVFRCTHLGTLELEIIIGDYMKRNAESMSYEDLIEFENQIVDTENPKLQDFLINKKEMTGEYDSKYMNLLKQYVEDSKANWAQFHVHL